jgi:hypothetical protein
MVSLLPLLTRLAVFVEGPHDQIILEEWFGEELRSAGIRVYPVHGVDNLTGWPNRRSRRPLASGSRH